MTAPAAHSPDAVRPRVARRRAAAACPAVAAKRRDAAPRTLKPMRARADGAVVPPSRWEGACGCGRLGRGLHVSPDACTHVCGNAFGQNHIVPKIVYRRKTIPKHTNNCESMLLSASDHWQEYRKLQNTTNCHLLSDLVEAIFSSIHWHQTEYFVQYRSGRSPIWKPEFALFQCKHKTKELEKKFAEF